MGKAGRKPLEPRIEALEIEVARLAQVIANRWPPQPSNYMKPDSGDAEVHISDPAYKPAFDKWPSKTVA